MTTVREQIQVELRAEFAGLRRDLAAAQSTTRSSTREMQAEWAGVRRAIGGASSAVTGLVTVIAGAYAIGAMKDVSNSIDTWNLVESRIRLVVDTTEELTKKQAELFAISQNARVGYESTAALYTRIARNTKSLNIEQSRLLTVTNAISKALVISGASATSADAALVQLTQGFAANALRGQELNSVMEQIPRVSEAIATGMGVTIGQLRALAAEGKLTTEVVISAIEKQAKTIDSEFTTMKRTMGQATIQMKNSWSRFLAELDKSLLITQHVNELIDELTASLGDQDASVVGIQNTWVTASRSIVVHTQWMVDQGILAYASLTSVWDGIPAFFEALWVKIKASWAFGLDSISIAAAHAFTSIRLNALESLDSIAGITVKGIQITPDVVVPPEVKAAAKAELEALENELAIAHDKYTATLEGATKSFQSAVREDGFFLEAATNKALLTIEQRYALLGEEAKKAAETRKQLEDSYKRPPQITTTGLSDVERKALNKLLKIQEAVNVELTKRASLMITLNNLENRNLGIVDRALITRDATIQKIQASMRAAANAIQQYKKLISGATETQLLKIQANIAKEQNNLIRGKIGLERAEIAYQVALRNDLDLQKQISEELRAQGKAKFDIREAKKVTIIPQNPKEQREAELVLLRHAVDTAKVYYENAKNLENTEANRLKILQAETKLLEAQAKLVKKQTEERKKLYKAIQETISTTIKVFGDTGDFEAALGSAVEGAINQGLSNARQGEYGAEGVAIAAGIDVVRGLVNTSAADIKAQRENARGVVEFSDDSLRNLGNLYERATSPLLLLVSETNRLLTAANDGISATARAATTGFNPIGFGLSTDLTGAGTSLHDTNILGGLNSITNDLIASGLQIEQQRLLSNQAGLQASGYQAIQTTDSNLFGLFSSTSTDNINRDLSSSLQTELDGIKANLVGTLRTAGESLGISSASLERQLRQVQIEQVKIELLGLTPKQAAEQLRQGLSQIFSSTVTQMESFSSLVKEFARGNESEFETLLRISREYQIAAAAVADTNVVIPDGVIAPEDLAYYNRLAEEYRRGGSIVRAAMQIAMDDLKQSRQEIILQLAQQAGGADRLSSLTSAYLQDYFTSQEIATKSLANIKATLSTAGIDLPDTKEAYRALVEAQDLSTKKGREMYLLLLELAPSFSDAKDALAAVGDEVKKLPSEYDAAYREAITGAFTLYTSQEQESRLRTLALSEQARGDQESYLDSLKAATQAAFRTSPTREAYEAKFNEYVNRLQEPKKDLDDVYTKMEDIQEVLEKQAEISEQNAYQAVL